MRTENLQLDTIRVDVQLQPNGKYDVWIAGEGDSGMHYIDVTANEIGANVADLIECYTEAIEQVR